MGKKKGKALPPVFEACDTDDAEGLATVLDSDPASLELRNGDGWTPLIQASFAGSLECVELLLKRGAVVAVRCKDNCLASHYASAQGHVEVFKALLAAGGAKMLAADDDGETCVDVAQKGKAKKAIELLVAEFTASAEEGVEDDGDEDAAT